jgi:hypothetical protein
MSKDLLEDTIILHDIVTEQMSSIGEFLRKLAAFTSPNSESGADLSVAELKTLIDTAEKVGKFSTTLNNVLDFLLQAETRKQAQLTETT